MRLLISGFGKSLFLKYSFNPPKKERERERERSSLSLLLQNHFWKLFRIGSTCISAELPVAHLSHRLSPYLDPIRARAPFKNMGNRSKHHTDRAVHWGEFSVVQWLRLHTPSAGGPGSIPGLGTRSYMPQLSANMLKIPRAATKTW